MGAWVGCWFSRVACMSAQAHGKTGGEAQEWARAMLGTVGRGGNAQAGVSRHLP